VIIAISFHGHQITAHGGIAEIVAAGDADR